MNLDRLHYEHIIEAVTHLQAFITRQDAEKMYHEDWLTQAGVLRTLQTLSESAHKLSPKIKERYPEIPWPKIGGMRNALVHGYLGELDLETVWQTIRKDLTQLKNCLEAYAKETKND